MSKIEVDKDVTVQIGDETHDGVLYVRTTTDAGFTKVWIDMMMKALCIVGEKKGRVIGYMMNNRDSNNRVHGTFEQIASEAKVSRRTVADTLKALQESSLVTKEYDGVYLVNPDWVWNGHHKKRLKVFMDFQELRSPSSVSYSLPPTPEESAAE